VPAPRTPAQPPPVALDIPAIGVRTPLIPLGLRDDGTVAVPPPDPDAPAGWYRHGVAPGTVGAAVLLGHVDSAKDGPAVFYRLRELTPGATVRVERADGSTAVFTVTRTARYRKKAFPTLAVYGPTTRPELRLVTCGGRFDRARRSYRDNLVVYAGLLDVIAPPLSR
jgi:sortase (surface protein transpeptidase)